MLINPKVTKLIIFNAGGGIVEREIKLSVTQGINEFQIEDVPASFDPNSADITLEYLNSADEKAITLQQTIVALPDMNYSNKIIEREKSAANNIINYAIDFTREMREKVSNICESSSYRTYADMKGIFDFIIKAETVGEVLVKITYFISDLRINWHTSIQVNIGNDGENAEVEGFIIVDNKTGFSYENVELGFAIFELPKPSSFAAVPRLDDMEFQEQEFPAALRQEISRRPLKRTQRLKNLMM